MLNPSPVPARQRVCVLLGGPLEAPARVAPRVAALLRPPLCRPA